MGHSPETGLLQWSSLASTAGSGLGGLFLEAPRGREQDRVHHGEHREQHRHLETWCAGGGAGGRTWCHDLKRRRQGRPFRWHEEISQGRGWQLWMASERRRYPSRWMWRARGGDSELRFLASQIRSRLELIFSPNRQIWL